MEQAQPFGHSPTLSDSESARRMREWRANNPYARQRAAKVTKARQEARKRLAQRYFLEFEMILKQVRKEMRLDP